MEGPRRSSSRKAHLRRPRRMLEARDGHKLRHRRSTRRCLTAWARPFLCPRNLARLQSSHAAGQPQTLRTRSVRAAQLEIGPDGRRQAFRTHRRCSSPWPAEPLDEEPWTLGWTTFSDIWGTVGWACFFKQDQMTASVRGCARVSLRLSGSRLPHRCSPNPRRPTGPSPPRPRFLNARKAIPSPSMMPTLARSPAKFSDGRWG